MKTYASKLLTSTHVNRYYDLFQNVSLAGSPSLDNLFLIFKKHYLHLSHRTSLSNIYSSNTSLSNLASFNYSMRYSNLNNIHFFLDSLLLNPRYCTSLFLNMQIEALNFRPLVIFKERVNTFFQNISFNNTALKLTSKKIEEVSNFFSSQSFVSNKYNWRLNNIISDYSTSNTINLFFSSILADRDYKQ